MKKSTPESRLAARDNAVIVGDAQRVIMAEIRDTAKRVADARVTPYVAVAGFAGFIGFVGKVVESVNL